MSTPHQHAIGKSPTEHGSARAGPEPLPDLLGLSLAELRRLDHPALSAVLDELRVRVIRPGETFWESTSDPRPDDDDDKTNCRRLW
jgi:hypothetical protein